FACQFPVSHGHYDPLAAVAALLQFAGLLQRLDAGLPVSRPVLDPSQILPSLERLREVLDGLLARLDGPFGIAELGVRVVDQLPSLLLQDIAKISVDNGVVRV